MKPIHELYNDSSYGWSDYQPMLDEIGTILVQVDDEDYQGDSRVFYYKDGKYGYLIFGWGSCSGCDSLQACGDLEDVQSLFDSLVNDTKWFNSLGEIQEYFKQKDWELEYSWYADETKAFIEQVISFREHK